MEVNPGSNGFTVVFVERGRSMRSTNTTVITRHPTRVAEIEYYKGV
jgi:hypothetical protein